MFTSKGCNKRIDKLHETSLRLILNDYDLSCYDILSILNEETIFQLSIKSKRSLPGIDERTFLFCPSHYNLCSLNVFTLENPRNKFFLNSTVYLANEL